MVECKSLEKLKFNWTEVHEIAEQLEHIQSVSLIEKLDEFLCFPKYDPHGEPIPNAKGEFPTSKRRLLSQINFNQKVKMIGVKEDSSVFLKYLDKLQLGIGDTISIIAKEDFDESYTIQIKY